MRRLLIVSAAVVAAACVWLAISMRGDDAPAPAADVGAGSSAAAPVAPSPAASPTTAPSLASSTTAAPAAAPSDDDRPAWEGQDLPAPPDPPAGGVARAPRPEKKPLTPDEKRAMEAKGVALLDLQIASLQKELDAATAAHDDPRAAQLRVRLTRMEDTRRIRQAALDAPTTPAMH